MFARLYLKIGELAACVLPDATIAVSQSLKNYALKKYGKKYGSCISYIPNGVSLGEVAGAEKISEWGLEKDNYILTVSRLVRHKGIHYLLEAYKKIKTDKKLVIVGESSFTDNYVSELKKQAAEDKNIIFTGAQNGEKLKELFANSYLFIQPSESEGLSIALLEAMAYGRCALVSDIPENKEAVGEAGFTFINKNAADLADKMNFLLTNPDLTVKTGQAARIRAEKYYNWKAITEEIIKVYEQASLKRKEKKQRF
jgi:glycosyltransferase involved in cell wall biosynthesis